MNISLGRSKHFTLVLKKVHRLYTYLINVRNEVKKKEKKNKFRFNWKSFKK